MIDVVEPGLLTTVQDLGRPGYAHLGVPPSGAADVPSLVRANRLAGNEDGAAALEATLAGPTLRFLADAVVAVAGGIESEPLELAEGDTLEVGPILAGVRAYIAVRGVSRRVIASRSSRPSRYAKPGAKPRNAAV